MSDIVTGRMLLDNFAETLPPDKARILRAIVRDYLIREPATRKAPAKSAKVTPEIKEKIVELAGDFPEMHVSRIAELVGVNPGRVSEVLNGKR